MKQLFGVVLCIFVVLSEGVNICEPPKCNSLEELYKLWPHPDPNFFYQCFPVSGKWEAKKMACFFVGTLFGFEQQKCVEPSEWNYVCQPFNCPIPNCDHSSLTTMWNDNDPNFYIKCVLASNGLVPARYACGNNTLFSFGQQKCVEPSEWEYQCGNSSIPTTTEIITTITSSTAPSTECNSSPETTRTTRSTTEITPQTTTSPETTTSPKTTMKPVPETTRTTTESSTEITTTTTELTPETTITEPAPETTPPPQKCQPPNCNIAAEQNRLSPHINPVLYWQCRPTLTGSYEAFVRACNPGTYFHHTYQNCVWPHDWENVC